MRALWEGLHYMSTPAHPNKQVTKFSQEGQIPTLGETAYFLKSLLRTKTVCIWTYRQAKPYIRHYNYIEFWNKFSQGKQLKTYGASFHLQLNLCENWITSYTDLKNSVS